MKLAGVFLGGVLVAFAGLFLFASKESHVLEPVQALAESLSFSEKEVVVIFMAGDMFFDRKIRQISEAQGPDFVFSCIDELITRADFAVANLEGPITTHASRSVGSIVGSPDNFVFTFPPHTAATLARHRFRAVGIGNNHITNFGMEGLRSTQEYLSEAGVGFFGGVRGNEAIFEITEKGVDIAFVGYNEFGGSSPKDVANQIALEKSKGKIVIVFAHWGDEYVDASPRLRPIAELFANSGASAVIGAHPHVVLGSEYIGGTLVYYSLGNFIFDKYWNAEVSHGLTLLLTVHKSGIVSVEEHPTQIYRDGRICPVVQSEVI
jgi:poly-gamma-glutamate capsule biosynthesis protein CapA/YwtB (metallophosphatase superfamily)